MTIFKTLISATELTALQGSGAAGDGRLVVLDCRGGLGDPAAGPAAWAQGHLPNARHANLETQLAAPPHSLAEGGGGRHPLPDRQRLAEQCAAWGISSTTQVVVYDDLGGAFAARAWWLLRWLGHAAVAVLDGGLQAWLAQPGNELSTDQPAAAPGDFVASEPLTRQISRAEVLDLVTAPAKPTATLLDARSAARFAGEEEPIDPVAGHIPGALCFPYNENLTDDGRFRAPEELAERFAQVAAQSIVCYCGSGVTAAHNVLALRHAGLPEPQLYVGSWSEWCADERLPRAP